MPPAPVRLVAITDRRRMVAPDLLARGDWAAIAHAFAAAIAALPALRAPGALVQVREKDLDGRPLLALVRAALATGARVTVNDRLDVALAAGAHGVHLPEHGLSIEAARALLAARAGAASAEFLIGASRHSIESAHAAARAGADLVQLSPIFDAPGKGPPLGPAALTSARAGLAPAARLVALGGIDADDRAHLARSAGADAVAAIRGVWSRQLDLERLLARA